MRFNGDTGNNYDYQISQYGSSLTAGEALGAPFIHVFNVTSASAGFGNSFGQGRILISNYSTANVLKSVFAHGASRNTTTAGSQVTQRSAGHWRTTDPITTINLQGNSAVNLAIGSYVYLYGIPV